MRRFLGYAIPLPPVAAAYAQAVAALPAYQEWAAGAQAENDFYAADEPYRQPAAARTLGRGHPTARHPSRSAGRW